MHQDVLRLRGPPEGNPGFKPVEGDLPSLVQALTGRPRNRRPTGPSTGLQTAAEQMAPDERAQAAANGSGKGRR
jgi:hypothetical protein